MTDVIPSARTRYAYRLTDKGVTVVLIFVLFHQQLCGPLANNLRRLPIRFAVMHGPENHQSALAVVHNQLH
ncbi:MAG: hypothetical protein EXR27_20725 [Betaproteobacteria bacterium]|nr:hypothetical protein [Betaproteobacteria bacterium]